MIEQPQPWERLQREPDAAWGAFVYYRDTNPRNRSIKKCVNALYGTLDAVSSWEKYSVKWRWRERVEAWDAEQDRVAREARLEAIRQMDDRHVSEARALQAKALERLRQIDPKELKPREVLNYLIEAAKLERLAMGQPDQIVEQRQGRAEDLTDDELADIILRGRPGA